MSHRVSLCPIDQSTIKSQDKSVPFRLSFKGPGVVYTGDCTTVRYSNPHIPICSLEKDKRMVIDCHLIKGDATEHALYNPICNVQIYSILPINGRRRVYRFN